MVEVDFDSRTLFNLATAFVATLAGLVFLLSVDLGYSPVSKYLLVVAYLGGLFAVTQSTDDGQLTLFGYAAVVVVVLGLFFEVIGTFDLGDVAMVLGLLVLAALLFALRDRLDENHRFAAARTAKYAFLALLAFAVIVTAVDVTTGSVDYELRLDGEVTFDRNDRRQVQVGAVDASNPTPLPERVDVPNYRACTAGNWSAYAITREPEARSDPPDVHLSVDDGYNEHVLSFGEKTYPVVLNAHGNFSDTTVPIQRTDSCPGESGEPYVAVFEVEDDRRFYAD